MYIINTLRVPWLLQHRAHFTKSQLFYTRVCPFLIPSAPTRSIPEAPLSVAVEPERMAPLALPILRDTTQVVAGSFTNQPAPSHGPCKPSGSSHVTCLCHTRSRAATCPNQLTLTNTSSLTLPVWPFQTSPQKPQKRLKSMCLSSLPPHLPALPQLALAVWP